MTADGRPEIPLPAELELLRAEGKLTVEQMRNYLAYHLGLHPEIKQGLVLEVWWDGRMAGYVGGGLSMSGMVTTIEHPHPDAWKRMNERPLSDFWGGADKALEQ